jgi:uncharacterized protein YceK
MNYDDYRDFPVYRMLLVVLICIAGLSSGCATVMTGTDQNITVVTEKNVTAAKCELTDAKSKKWYVPSTPGSANVHRGDGPMSVICEKSGYRTANLMVDETIAGATLGNILIGGGVGIIVDAVSGAAQRYPDQITVWMEPESWSSENERLEWIKEKGEFDAKMAASEQAAAQSSTPSPLGK